MSARIYLLGAGAFAVGTSAYVVSGVLPDVSSELHVSLTAAGQLATAFSLSYAIGAPILSTLTGRWERRTLLIAALVLAALGNLIAALAVNYPILIVGRIVAAFGAAVYTPAATLFATSLMPPEKRGRAVAIVFGGLTFALVLGVPAGTLLGPTLGYKGVFALISAVAVLVAIAERGVLPKVEAPPVVSLRERFAGVADRRVQIILAMTVLAVLAAFTVYIYIVPLLKHTAGLTGKVTSLLLLMYGVGAVIGNFLGGRITDRFGSLRTLFVLMAAITVVLATLDVTLTTAVGAGAALVVWGMLTWAFNPPVQSLLMELGGGLLISLNASAIYLGAGLSAVVGGLVIQTLGVGYLPVLASALSLVVVGLVYLLWRDSSLQQVEELERDEGIYVTATAD
ncbi:MFS transporter [Kribbella solani]|uniref:Putative MFS family arabinose efflux permease n=1 Tax=Kribbella solani TaxID=236067 RepID=A0A841DWT7_9ACTN|nr:MFS transporter [Kribbella solani]MBB5983102.1 putative MFS family arabinose efflux permease [Kribbella solani]MDX2971184.1 MFS transporter [Kribbella solani]MDX3000617.1 MFS transporter [Kribbella solani]